MTPRPVLVGFSGGLDSTALLHMAAASAGINASGLRAIHVHHGLHSDADAWAVHCQRFCDGLNVPLTILHVVVARDRGTGLEAAAREARHAVFAAELRDGEVLALAHHRDDQAETFLLRALRASGPDGLGAMRPWRRYGNGWLWRPLLAVPRSELLAYARQRRLEWIEDPANVDVLLDRNFLRHRVLPVLRERWPHADAALARSAALSMQAADLLSEEDEAALAAIRADDARSILVPALRGLPVARRARVLRCWIASLGLPALPASGIARIEGDLLDAAPDAVPAFAWSGATVRRWRDLLHGGVQHEPFPPAWETRWDGRTPLMLPDGGELRLLGADSFDAPVRVHARQGGERILLPGRAHSHALKHVLQDANMPPWLRQRLPLLSGAHGGLLAAGDVVRSAGFDAWLRERGASLSWRHAD